MAYDPATDPLFDRWVAEKDAASLLGISSRALAKLRKKGEAPPNLRVSPRGKVLYPLEGIDDYLRELWQSSLSPESLNPDIEKIEEL